VRFPMMITTTTSTTKRTTSNSLCLARVVATGFVVLLLPLVAVVGHETTTFSAHDHATTAFTKRVTCPQDASLQGYVSIADLNADILEEFERIEEGGASPPNPYMISLCPGQTFNVGQDGPLTPILDRMFIQCGSGSTSSSTVDITINPCILDGGVIQIDIQDSPYRVPLKLDFYGLTFQNFEVGAIQASATGPSTATFTNSKWTVRRTAISSKKASHLDCFCKITNGIYVNLCPCRVFRVFPILLCRTLKAPIF
jgi:hypothetical protein